MVSSLIFFYQDVRFFILFFMKDVMFLKLHEFTNYNHWLHQGLHVLAINVMQEVYVFLMTFIIIYSTHSTMFKCSFFTFWFFHIKAISPWGWYHPERERATLLLSLGDLHVLVQMFCGECRLYLFCISLIGIPLFSMSVYGCVCVSGEFPTFILYCAIFRMVN